MSEFSALPSATVEHPIDEHIPALRRLAESARLRKPLSDEEKALVLEKAAQLQAMGHSPGEWLWKLVVAESALRVRLGLALGDNRIPTVQESAPLISSASNECPWPACDFLLAPSLLVRLLFLRQQNLPSTSRVRSNRRSLKELELWLWQPEASNTLWNLRLLLGGNRATEEAWAPKKDLDQLCEALRFNSGRRGRRPDRALGNLVERELYAVFRSFHGLLKRAQREIPKALRDEEGIRSALAKSGFPAFLLDRLAQEISEHRSRRQMRLTLEDRASLWTVELEGKRGRFALPEPLARGEAITEEDAALPIIVATRKPPLEPLLTTRAKTAAYEKVLARTLDRARSRIRRLKKLWTS